MKKNVDLDTTKFKIIFTKEFQEDIKEIHNYISIVLKEKESADRLISKVLERVSDLRESPRLYMKIGKFNIYNGLQRVYRRMIVNNYIILYTVNYESQEVFISHMFYKRKNYLN